VDDGIRTHNNRNHKASVSSVSPEKSKTSKARRRLKTAKKHG